MGQSSSRDQNSFLEDHRTGVQSKDLDDVNTVLSFPFLKDEDTILYMKCSKIMIILRGLPGSGKSFLAQKLQTTYGNSCQVCSVDDYFMQGTHYRFDPTRLDDAIKYCQETASLACRSGHHVVVIDSANVELQEMSNFIALAKEKNYVLLVEEPCTEWKFDAFELATKSRHNVSEEEVNEKLKCWEEIVPLYFAWFLNASDSLSLVNIAEAYLDECVNISQFLEVFQDVMSFEGCNDLHDYFNFTSREHILHCTTHFCGNRTTKDEYMMQESVRQNYGSRTLLSVVGFVVTPQTFLARVKLSSQQLKLWGQDDFETPAIQDAVDVARCPSSEATTARRRDIGHLTVDQDWSESVCIATLRPYSSSEKRTKQFFRPTEGLGQRAHITLGCARGVKPVQAGFDLMEAVEMEKAFAKLSVPTFDIGCGKLRRYGDATWVIYPYKMYVIDALFAFFML